MRVRLALFLVATLALGCATARPKYDEYWDPEADSATEVETSSGQDDRGAAPFTAGVLKGAGTLLARNSQHW